MKLIMLLLLGAIGGIARYALGQNALDILLANVAGAMCLGFIIQLAESNSKFTPWIRDCIAVGLLGSFTTFSTFAMQAMRLMSEHEWLAAAYILGTMLGGVCFTLVGMRLANVLKHRSIATNPLPSARPQTTQQRSFETGQE